MESRTRLALTETEADPSGDAEAVDSGGGGDDDGGVGVVAMVVVGRRAGVRRRRRVVAVPLLRGLCGRRGKERGIT